MIKRTRLEKMERCQSLEELDGFLDACRKYGDPLSNDETQTAQRLRAQFLGGTNGTNRS